MTSNKNVEDKSSNLVARLVAHVEKLEVEGHEYGCKAIDYGDDGPQFINEDCVCTCGWAALKKEASSPDETTAPHAIQALTAALQADPEYAWSWHCNLSMPVMDSLKCSHEQANAAGAALMQHLFKIDIRQHQHWQYGRSAVEPTQQHTPERDRADAAHQSAFSSDGWPSASNPAPHSAASSVPTGICGTSKVTMPPEKATCQCTNRLGFTTKNDVAPHCSDCGLPLKASGECPKCEAVRKLGLASCFEHKQPENGT